MSKLNEMQLKFVSEYLKTSSPTASAIAAGYAPAGAKSQAYQLLRNPKIKAELQRVQALVQEEGVYNLKKALADAEEAYQVAKANENAAAMTAAATLKAKLSGLMVDRSEVKQIGFMINITGYDDS